MAKEKTLKLLWYDPSDETIVCDEYEEGKKPKKVKIKKLSKEEYDKIKDKDKAK